MSYFLSLFWEHAGNALAVFTREERERFEFYLLRSEWVAYEVPKYLLPVENRAQQTEN